MKFKQPLLASAVILTAVSQSAVAQEQDAQRQANRQFLGEQLVSQLEETVVLGKLQSAAGDIVLERMQSEAATDIIGAEQISRIGDSSVATALRRVPGVTLVDDKFIYVRGLGERYSSSQLNGAVVPSPDLTRSVLPLDIFPTSIVESLAVQKTYSSDMPAAFGGGNVDIRTKGIPTEFKFFVEVGAKYNNETSGNGLNYAGGGDDALGTDDGTRGLPAAVSTALDTYAGQLNSFAIRDRLIRDSGFTLDAATATAQAQQINRELASEMNRRLNITEGDTGENYSAEVGVGNNWLIENGWELGFLAGASYSNEYVTRSTVDREFSNPLEEVSFREETSRKVNITSNLALGLRLNDDNEIRTTSLFIRNSDDDVSIANYFDDNRRLSDASGFQDYDFRFEERELVVNQMNGEHRWSEDTKALIGIDESLLSFFDGLEFSWFYSDATATTDIPGETNVEFQTVTDPLTGAVLDSTVNLSESTVDYRYTQLDDEVQSYGYDLKLPLYFDRFTLDLSGGWDYNRKSRTYRQTDLFLGSSDPDVLAFVDQDIESVLSDENILNPDLGFAVNVNTGSSRSYLAAVTNESVYAKVDINWEETIRLILGARYESYNQVGLPWQPLNYTTGQITTDPDELAAAAFSDDAVYPSAAVVFMLPDFLAETYQIRLSYSETVVRPDLREITETSYQDPINDEFLIFGNQNVVPSDVKNYDLRNEWFFSNGDNLTLSLFYKDITNPIEFFERPASDRKRAAQIQNAQSGEIFGIEAEWLKDMSFLGDAFAPFFLAGNVTLADSELIAGDLPTPPTNPTRTLSGASDYVVNMQVGFDSDDGKHAATLVYNVFGERLRSAGINGGPDTFERPFNSVDLTYSYYPTINTTLKLKLKNLLDEQVELEELGVTVYEEQVGLTASLDFKWEF